MSGHTKGPWVFIPFMAREGTPNEGDMGGFKHGTSWVCHFGDSEQYYPTEGRPPSIENSRLIQASPDLLDALILANAYLMGEPSPRGLNGADIADIVQSAIAAATGEKE